METKQLFKEKTMSCYYVNENIFSVIANLIKEERTETNRYNKALAQNAITYKCEFEAPEPKTEDFQAIAKELQELNIDSLNNRYSNDDSKTYPVRNFHNVSLTKDIEMIKEYLYQCSEAKDKSGIYAEVKAMQLSLLNRFFEANK